MSTDLTSPRLARLGDLIPELEGEAEAAYQALVNGMARGPVTGLGKVDRELGGVLQNGPHFVHGGPGIGKTAFCLQLAASAGCAALYVSTEMGLTELLRRHTARVTKTFLSRLKSGEYTGAQVGQLARQAATAAPFLTFADATRVPAPLAWLRTAAEIARGESEHFLIVIDSVHSWAEGAFAEQKEYDALGQAVLSIRYLASSLACPVVGIAERNRGAMETGGLSASAGSRKFEYGAESVLDLTKKKDAVPDAAGELDVILSIEKNRNGAVGGKVVLKFHGALQRFTEAA